MWTGVLVNYRLPLDFAYVNIKVEILTYAIAVRTAPLTGLT